MLNEFFEFSPEVYTALLNKQPILALESTIITHGLPKPINLQTALALEKLVRNEGAVPATIACMNGKIKIGLCEDELVSLAEHPAPFKASKRDLSFVISQHLTAGTTVAATLFCAEKAGITIFATGGIGGVHRGEMGDVSADLIELSQTKVAVICAGAKAILDIPKTLEFLETFSVPIIGFQTVYFPEFYSCSTNWKLTTSVESVAELAEILKVHWKLGPMKGILIANPPPDNAAMPHHEIAPLVEKAIEKSITLKIYGKALTPFLLQEMASITRGSSIETNIALVKNNVSLGAKLVRQLAGPDL